ncbi:MAG: hypothetical protein IIC93_01490 [Chloroflexi bacterium]|nr:hypothetical protein [Chloroflexota bacterium]
MRWGWILAAVLIFAACSGQADVIETRDADTRLAISATITALLNPQFPATRPAHIEDVVVHASFSDDVLLRDNGYSGTGRGISWGTVRPARTEADAGAATEAGARINSDDAYRLEAGESFTTRLKFSSHTPNDALFMVIALVDYEQVEFQLDGINGLLHEVPTPHATELEMAIDFGPLSIGAHDVQILLISDPYSGYDLDTDENFSVDLNFDFSTIRADAALTALVGSRREVVIVGGSEEPAREIVTTYLGKRPPANVRPWDLVSIARPGLAHPSEFDSRIRSDVADAGAPYGFRLWTNRWEGHGSGRTTFTAFLDYHQVELNGYDLLTAELDPGEEAILDVAVMLPDEPGTHQLLAYAVADPYAMRGERYLDSDFSDYKLLITAR